MTNLHSPKRVFTQILKSQQGFNLIEVMIAATIGLIVIGLISMAIVTGTEHDIRLLTRQEARDGFVDLREIVKGPACGIVKLLGDDGTATGATSLPMGNGGIEFFSATAANPKNISSTYNEIELNETGGTDGLMSETMRMERGQMYGSKLRVRDIRIMPMQIATATPDGDLFAYGVMGSGDQVRAQLMVTFDRLGQDETQQQTAAPLRARAPVILHIDRDRKGIVNCSSVEQLANNQQACENFGGNWNEETLTCDLATENFNAGQPMTCAVDERCNVLDIYVINQN